MAQGLDRHQVPGTNTTAKATQKPVVVGVVAVAQHRRCRPESGGDAETTASAADDDVDVGECPEELVAAAPGGRNPDPSSGKAEFAAKVVERSPVE